MDDKNERNCDRQPNFWLQSEEGATEEMSVGENV